MEMLPEEMIRQIAGYLPMEDRQRFCLTSERIFGAVHTLCAELCVAAAATGDVEMLRRVHQSGHVWHLRACVVAVTHGYLDCLVYAHEHGCDLSLVCDEDDCDPDEYADLCEVAARHGHLDCLQYVHEHGCELASPAVCSAAAEHGHLDCLRYAREHGCPWDRQTCTSAVFGGHLDCLQYAHGHGCRWYRDVSVIAARRGHGACLRYIREQGDCQWARQVLPRFRYVATSSPSWRPIWRNETWRQVAGSVYEVGSCRMKKPPLPGASGAR